MADLIDKAEAHDDRTPERRRIDTWSAENPRDRMALIAVAAWLNTTPDKLPKEMRLHTCAATKEAWARVVDAIRALPARGVGEAYEAGLQTALGLIASIGYGKNEDVDRGHEEAFGAVAKHLQDLRDAKSAALAPTDAPHVNETPKSEHDAGNVLTDAQARAPFFFDRYINGVRMAEGVCIERETTLEGAMQAAVRIAAKGPKGEAPVLVYRAPTDAAQAREAALDAIKAGFWSAAPGEWRVGDIERVTDAILRAMEGRDG